VTTIVIRTRDFGVLNFNCPDHPNGYAGYIIVREEGSTRWRQPCDGGGYMGNTLTANNRTLRRTALRWIRQRRKQHG
jgi:hypothetical protein